MAAAAGAKHSALFVCLGNICRSPIAEAIFKSIVEQKKCESDWYIDSAATSRYEIGELPDKRGLKVMRSHGLDSRHRARQITSEDYKSFEYVLCMDDSNMSDLKRMAPRGGYKAQIKLLGSFDKGGPEIIEDPYYGEEEDFKQAYTQCRAACEGFFEFVQEQK